MTVSKRKFDKDYTLSNFGKEKKTVKFLAGVEYKFSADEMKEIKKRIPSK